MAESMNVPIGETTIQHLRSASWYGNQIRNSCAPSQSADFLTEEVTDQRRDMAMTRNQHERAVQKSTEFDRRQSAEREARREASMPPTFAITLTPITTLHRLRQLKCHVGHPGGGGWHPFCSQSEGNIQSRGLKRLHRRRARWAQMGNFDMVGGKASLAISSGGHRRRICPRMVMPKHWRCLPVFLR